MTDQQINLPASFGKAHDLSSPAAKNVGAPIFTGTILKSGKIQHFERGMYMTIADVSLDDNAVGLTSAKLVTLHNNHDIEGRRVRGPLLITDKEQKDIRAHGIPGFDWAHVIMKQAPAPYFDLREIHLAADDPFLAKSGNVIDENHNALGFFSSNKAHDYYQANGFQILRKPVIDASPNPWKRLLALNPFNKPPMPDHLK